MDRDRITGGFDDDFILGGDGDDRILGNDGDDSIEGEAENDRIIGGRGNDSLNGGDGDDTLSGGKDGDFYFGGDGQDAFQFASISDFRITDPDEISSFDRPGAPEGDVLDFSRIDADQTLPGNQALIFGAGKGTGAIWLKNDTAEFSRDTLIFLNVDNDNAADFMVRVFDGRGIRAGEYSVDDLIL